MIDSSKIISVIVPVYNQEKYLARCLRSLLSQNYSREDYEILVIDDGSDDKTPFIIEQFSGDIRHIKNKKKIGLPGSLNIGIKSCKSKYVVRVDSDDYVSSNFLLMLTEFAEQNLFMDAIACDYHIVNDIENIQSRHDPHVDPIACGILFRTEQLIEIGLYDKDFLANEEIDLRLRFQKKYKIHRLALPLYRYRKHENNMTNNNKFMKKYNDKIIKKHKNLIDD